MARISDLEDPAFGALFAGVRESWFRLETLQSYDVAYERGEFAAFLRGGQPDMTPGPWQEMIAAHVAAGRELSRVHVVSEPLSDYMRYELACYPLNAAAGENIRILPVPEGHWPPGIGYQDFWLFDDRDVWLMAYDRKGRFRYAELRPGLLGLARSRRDVATMKSVPLADYQVPALRAS